jgi:AraC-like DNA-binding protein
LPRSSVRLAANSWRIADPLASSLDAAGAGDRVLVWIAEEVQSGSALWRRVWRKTWGRCPLASDGSRPAVAQELHLDRADATRACLGMTSVAAPGTARKQPFHPPYLTELSDADATEWSRVVSRTLLAVRLSARSAAEFTGSLRTRTVNGVRLSDVATSACESHTGAAAAGRTSPGYILCLQIAGSGVIRQDDKVVELGPGDAALYATHRASSVMFRADFHALSVQVPGDVIDMPTEHVDRLAAVRLEEGAGLLRVLADYLAQLHVTLDEMKPASRRCAVRALVDMTSTVVQMQGKDAVWMPGADRGPDALREQIVRYVDDHLDDVELSPASIAQAQYISTRYLHKLFRDSSETVGALVRRRRLEQCARDLANSGLADEPVAAIAWRWGFESASHFGQLFRERYGHTPAEFRRQAFNGVALSTVLVD